MRWVVGFFLAPFAIVAFFVLLFEAGQALGLTGGATGAGPGEIVMTEMRFSPNRILARAGQPITITLVNRGAQRHDFALTALHMPGLEPIETMTDPGQRLSFSFRIDVPGDHVFICTVPGHAAAGMTGVVSVLP